MSPLAREGSCTAGRGVGRNVLIGKEHRGDGGGLDVLGTGAAGLKGSRGCQLAARFLRHPRACGEQLIRASRGAVDKGSSPRVRGAAGGAAS